METIEELRKICQPEKVLNRGDESWYSKYFVRKFSIYLTYFFIKLKISANQITYLGFIFFIIGSVFLATSLKWLVLFGALFFHIFSILDSVDGELARYYKKKSILGAYLEKMSHSIIIPVMFLSLGINSYLISENISYLFFSISAMLAFLWSFAVTENKNSLYFEKNIKNISKETEQKNKVLNLGLKIFGLATILVIIFLLSIINLVYKSMFFYNIPIFGLILIFYGIFAHIPWVYSLIKNIVNDNISKLTTF
ncbi:MAG: CDP-alcohol phosphatidyltransferase family protein [Candidatus Pacearchaeota archaeon]